MAEFEDGAPLGDDEATIVGPPTADQATEEPEPEGVVDVQGRRMVDVSVVAAERNRVRESEKAAREKELEPLRAKAQEAEQLRTYLEQARPYIEHLRQHGLPQQVQPQEPQISDEEALAEARDLELYEAGTGKPDLARARRVILRRRSEASAAAREAAQSVIAPHAKLTATQASERNFAVAASQRDAEGNPLVSKETLAGMWGEFHRDAPELTQDPRVAQVLLYAAIGKEVAEGRRPRSAGPRPEPVYSEAAGGRPQGGFSLSDLDRKFISKGGLTKTQLEAGHKAFKPGQINNIEDL